MKAAQQDYVPAKAALGVLYTNRTGVQQNFAGAAKWCRLAASLGSAVAEDTLYWQTLYEAKNRAASFQAYMKVAQAGNWLAQTAVGLMYKGGGGVQQIQTGSLQGGTLQQPFTK